MREKLGFQFIALKDTQSINQKHSKERSTLPLYISLNSLVDTE